jgi:hypothetical protein
MDTACMQGVQPEQEPKEAVGAGAQTAAAAAAATVYQHACASD